MKIPKTVFILFVAVLFISCSMSTKELPITTSSKDALALYHQAQAFADNLKRQNAKELFEKALALDPEFAMAHLQLAFAEFGGGDADKAFDHYSKALSLKDKVSDGEKIFLDATEAGFTGDRQTQIEKLMQLVEMYPNDKRIYMNLGIFYSGQQDWNNAIGSLEKAIQVEPAFAPAYNQLAYIYLYSNQYDKAEKTIKKYTELIPDQANPWDSYAEILMKQGKFDESITAYKKALDLDPEFYVSYLGIGTNYMLMDQHLHSLDVFQTYYDKVPDYGNKRNAQFGMLRCRIDNQDYEKAMELLNTMYEEAKSNNNYVDMSNDVNVMGDVLFAQKDFQGALAKYDMSQALFESSEMVNQDQKEAAKQGLLFNQIRVDIKEARYEQAAEKISKYTQIAKRKNNSGQLRASHLLKGMLAMQQENWQDAATELEQANMRNPRVLYYLAKVYLNLGDKEKAKAYCEKAANFNEQAYVYAYVRKPAKEMLTGM